MTVNSLKVVEPRTDVPTAPIQRRRRLRIAAIVPLFNGAPFILQALESVLAQTRPADEVVVVDDGSTDDGPRLVEAYAAAHPVVRLLRQPNAGQSAARNRGVRETSSPLLAFLDQDDAWYPEHLKRLLQPFLDRGRRPLGWVYSNLDEVDRSGGLVSKSFLNSFPNEHPKRHLTSCLGMDMFVLPSASLISREAFGRVGGFDERLSGYEDDDLFLRLFRANYENVYLNEPLSFWRIYPTSSSYSYRMARSRMVYARKLFDQFPDTPEQNRFYRRDLIAPRFVGVLLHEYRKALKAQDRAEFERVVRDLGHILPYLAPRRRAPIERVWPVMSSYRLATTAFLLRDPLRPILARLGII